MEIALPHGSCADRIPKGSEVLDMKDGLFDLSGKTALVTGSSRGLGFVIAKSLGTYGAAVFLNGTSEETLAASVGELVKLNVEAYGIRFDVTDKEAVIKGIEEAEAHSPIDILVNNAGIQIRSLIADLAEDDWTKIMDVNLKGAFLVSQAVAAKMIPRRKGKIINICSLQSELARPSTAPYAASKGGLRMLTRSMAAEFAPYGIQVNAVTPGYFMTDMTKALYEDPEFDNWIRKRIPAARWGSPEELAGAAVFLASAASSYINGHILVVDGGLSAVI